MINRDQDTGTVLDNVMTVGPSSGDRLFWSSTAGLAGSLPAPSRKGSNRGNDVDGL